ncbi:MAG: Cytochrome c, partial [Verrucomicrobiales bacterium]|nr:Cytochrome c [Verrucomicrobiales bacterium]
IDTAADYTTDEGKVVRLTGAGDIAQFAINSEHAQSGFVEQLFHQIVKQPVLAYGPDVMDRLRQSFVASGYNMQKLLVEIATISALHRDEKAIATRK